MNKSWRQSKFLEDISIMEEYSFDMIKSSIHRWIVNTDQIHLDNQDFASTLAED